MPSGALLFGASRLDARAKALLRAGALPVDGSAGSSFNDVQNE